MVTTRSHAEGAARVSKRIAASPDRKSSAATGNSSSRGKPARKASKDKQTAQLRDVLGVSCRVQAEILEDFNTGVQKYNKLLSFVPARKAKSKRLQRSNAALLRCRERMSKVLETAFEEIDDLIQDALHNINETQSDLCEDPLWYEQDDLYIYDAEELEAILDCEPIQNAEHFSNYLLEITKQYIQTEHQSFDHRQIIRAYFNQKYNTLRKALEYSDDPHAEYHLFQFKAKLIGSVLPHNKVLYEEVEVRFLQTLSVLQMREQLEYKSPSTYLNCAGARREIWDRYKQVNCPHTSNPIPGLLREPENMCFHDRTIGLLYDLQVHAQIEIRHNVLLAVGNHLPAELAELIVESCLEAEEIPLDSTMHVKATDKKGPFGGAYPPYPVLQQYDCGRRLFWRIEYRDPDFYKERKSLSEYYSYLYTELAED